MSLSLSGRLSLSNSYYRYDDNPYSFLYPTRDSVKESIRKKIANGIGKYNHPTTEEEFKMMRDNLKSFVTLEDVNAVEWNMLNNGYSVENIMGAFALIDDEKISAAESYYGYGYPIREIAKIFSEILTEIM